MFVGIFSIVFFFFIQFSPALSSVSLSFNLSSFGSHETNRFINTTGDAYISNQGIQLTPNERNDSRINTAGRATYTEPLHLWDRNSGNLSDFSTRFSFIIDSAGSSPFADGITFFFAPVYSSLNRTTALGGSMGLNTDNEFANSSAEGFFAVEFDTFRNVIDPDFSPHIGIDISSMVSVATAEWRNDVSRGRETEAWISYNARLKIITVNFTGFVNDTATMGSLSHVVDLRSFMPEKVLFGFSGATGTYFQQNTIRSWEFSSNLELVIPPSPGPTWVEPTVPGSTRTGRRSRSGGMIAGLIGGLSALILLLAFAGRFLWKKKRQKKNEKETEVYDDSMDDEFEKGTGAKRFVYSELARATDGFAEELKLGEGGFGGVYRGLLKDGNCYVAVKRVSRGSHQGLKEYASEVKIISRLRHRNLVQLIGWCHERGELLLVYEFLSNGSLDSHIFRKDSVLLWEIRYKIAQGLASALLYLHEEWEQCVVHRDIKSSNIMLDSNFNAKLGDFGLARLVDHEKGSQTTMVAGTRGYMAPEYVISGRASKESDVYSFGVVLLEIVCGRKAIDFSYQETQIRLVEWVWKLYGKGKVLEAVDPELDTQENAVEMERLAILGLWCVHPDSHHRPSIRQARNVMNMEAEPPVLPLVMPVPIYYTPSMNMISSSNFSLGVSETMEYSHLSTNSSNFTASSAGSDQPSTSLLKAAS